MLLETKKIPAAKVLVVGDVMLDRYQWGTVSRISPEAPVPILKHNESTKILGGAGNVAANLAGLNCSVTLIGVTGADESGEALKRLLDDNNIKDKTLTDSTRVTTTKTRVMADEKQLLRIDNEKPDTLSPKTLNSLLELFQKELLNCQAVILSDYCKGIFQTQSLTQEFIALCREHNLPVLIDPKGTDWRHYAGATCLTPNIAELELISGTKVSDDVHVLLKTARAIRKSYNIERCLVTRGSNGVCLIDKDDSCHLIPAKAHEVFDVSGAGDTVIATLGAAIATGTSFEEAARIANHAAGIVVGKLGTQPIKFSELYSDLRTHGIEKHSYNSSKIVELADAILQVESWKDHKKSIVFTNGCFDLLHPGHIKLLHQARALGDRLIIGLNADSSIKRLKGNHRPILNEEERATMLSALGYVDLIVFFDDDTPLQLITSLKPDILVKGADYDIDEVVGKEVVESYGGQIKLISILKGYSTTKFIEKFNSKNEM